MTLRDSVMASTAAAVTVAGGLVVAALPATAASGDATCIAAQNAFAAGIQGDATLAGQLATAQANARTVAQSELAAAVNAASTGPTVAAATATLTVANAVQDPLVAALTTAEINLAVANAAVSDIEDHMTGTPPPATQAQLNAALAEQARRDTVLLGAQADLIAPSRTVVQAQAALGLAQAAATAVVNAQVALDAAIANGGSTPAVIAAQAALTTDLPGLAQLQGAVSAACGTAAASAQPVSSTVTVVPSATAANAVRSQANFTG